MGNRATLEVTDGNNPAPAYVYLHWHGDPEQVVAMVKQAAPRMRQSDASYATARLVGELHDIIEGGLSLGIIEASPENRDSWNNGHYIINMAAGTIEREYQSDDTLSARVEATGLAFGHF
jgi:hypothetical protein